MTTRTKLTEKRLEKIQPQLSYKLLRDKGFKIMDTFRLKIQADI